MSAAVEFDHVDKAFGAVQALRDVSFSIAEGEAHAVVGENGAGKSTLLKILAGSVAPDRGLVRVDGAPALLSSPREALTRGIGFVHQEMLAFPNLSVTANIFAGRELTGRFGWLREAAMRDRAVDLLARLQLSLPPDASVERLPVAHRQLLQVARALAFNCRTLALDEPTTSLTAAETEHLFQVLRDLKRAGVTLVYVSHRLPEVLELADRVTVMRDGRYVTTFDRGGVAADDLVQAMVGRAIPSRSRRPLDRSLEARLCVERLTRSTAFKGVSLTVRRGEIVAVFGLVGSGRTELVETLVGLHRSDSGSVTVDGVPCRFRSPRDAARAGVVLVPEDRQRQGLFFNLSLRHNLVLPAAEARRIRWISGAERATSRGMMHEWQIRAASEEVAPDCLSGGNQQKVVLAKWLALAPRVLLLDEPTKGVDVGAKFAIHETIRAVAASGTACVVVSSDLPEALALADRIVVMREGRIRGEADPAECDEERVMRMATSLPGEAA